MTGETYDGHVHTCLSDADPDQTPREVCRQARAAGLAHLAITDHDFMLDREERLALEEEFDLDVIPGCELSARTEISGIPHNVHIGGHWLNEQEPLLRQVLRVNQSQDFEAFRKEILRRCLRCGLDPGREGDVDRSYQMLLERNPQSNHYGRREVARLLAETGCVSSVREAQDQYLSAHGKRRAYVPGERYLRFAPLERVVEAIRASGGIATLNHLYAYRLRQEEEEARGGAWMGRGGLPWARAGPAWSAVKWGSGAPRGRLRLAAAGRGGVSGGRRTCPAARRGAGLGFRGRRPVIFGKRPIYRHRGS